MAVNKVEINGVVKLDLTADTVTAAKLAQGVTAHDASGEIIIGTMTAPQLQIVVTSNAGAIVTATKGSKTVSGTADASGNCTLTVDETGEWSVAAELDGAIGSDDVMVGTNAVVLQMFDPVFANNDWATIVRLCQENKVPGTWNVGDSCNMTINNKTYAIDIIGKNHDDYADGSGKAPLTFMLHTSYATLAYMNSSQTVNRWVDSWMRKSNLPNILKRMPAEVQAGVREVTKITGAGIGSANTVTSSEKLFLLSGQEVVGSVSGNQTDGEGTRYEYFKSSTDDRCNARVPNATSNSWWLRSPARNTGGSSDNFDFLCMYKDINTSKADITFSAGTTKNGVSFGFCF